MIRLLFLVRRGCCREGGKEGGKEGGGEEGRERRERELAHAKERWGIRGR